MCWSIDHHDTDLSGQATYHDGHKITFFLWQKWIRTVECGILAIKKLLWKLYKSDYIQSFQTCPLNMYMKKKKKFDCKRKIKFFYLNFSSIATLKKNKDNGFLCHLCFLHIYLFWLTPSVVWNAAIWDISLGNSLGHFIGNFFLSKFKKKFIK